MRFIHLAAIASLALSVNVSANINGQAYLGKDPAKVAEGEAMKREPQSIFVNTGREDIGKKLKSDFWEQYPNFKLWKGAGQMPSMEQNLLDSFMMGPDAGFPKNDIKKPVVHGLDTSISKDLREATGDSSNFSLPSAKEKNQGIVNYVESKSGWVRYGQVNTRFSEYIPEDVSFLAKFTDNSFRNVLLNTAKGKFSYIIEPTLKSLDFIEKSYDPVEGSPLVITDICAKSKRDSQTVVGRVWKTKDDNEILKFIIFESDQCLIG